MSTQDHNGKAVLKAPIVLDSGDYICDINVAAGALFLASNTGRCMFQLRNSDKRHKHTWGFFGGMLDPGESVYECLLRELREEIGTVPELAKLNPLDVYQSPDKRFYYYSFVYVVDDEFHPALNDESAGYAWVNIGQWPQPLHQGTKASLTKNGGVDKITSIWRINQRS